MTWPVGCQDCGVPEGALHRTDCPVLRRHIFDTYEAKHGRRPESLWRCDACHHLAESSRDADEHRRRTHAPADMGFTRFRDVTAPQRADEEGR